MKKEMKYMVGWGLFFIAVLFGAALFGVSSTGHEVSAFFTFMPFPLTMISIKEASQLTGIKPKTLYVYVKNKILPSYQFGNGKRKLIRIRLDDLMNWVDESKKR
jgi:excisionase family DNA binding protein